VSSLDGPVVTDPRSLERIVGNLLDNARRHAPDAPVTVAASLLDDRMVVEIADRGPGVAPEMLPRLSERFATADSARGSGTGLGLAIADEHARRLGGTLTPLLRAGGGMTFRLEIPVEQLLHGRESDETSTSDDGPEPSIGDTP
jgi:two-component system, OmpR family, sensor histidine kinase MtrB